MMLMKQSCPSLSSLIGDVISRRIVTTTRRTITSALIRRPSIRRGDIRQSSSTCHLQENFYTIIRPSSLRAKHSEKFAVSIAGSTTTTTILDSSRFQTQATTTTSSNNNNKNNNESKHYIGNSTDDDTIRIRNLGASTSFFPLQSSSLFQEPSFLSQLQSDSQSCLSLIPFSITLSSSSIPSKSLLPSSSLSLYHSCRYGTTTTIANKLVLTTSKLNSFRGMSKSSFHHQIRFYNSTLPSLNTNGKSNGSNNSSSTTKDDSSNEKKQQSTHTPQLPNQKQIQDFVDTTVSTVRAVTHLNTGDLLSVYSIIFLIFLIITAPYVSRQLRRSDGETDRDVDPEDPVMDLAQMIREEYYGDEKDTEDGEGRRTSGMGLDRIVADVLRSPHIQTAVTDLVTNIIQSEQFKTSCKLLLKELLKDLLDDPNTLQQVIHLLQNAIQDEKIKEASIQLVTEVFGDDRVLDELVVLVQRLGMEQQVQMATQALLVESAHNALNDPEILDHSMEFATDVVGDDVVQQTAGEALYNTLSYAIRPTLSVFLSLLGIGLIFLSISAFRNAREGPNDAADRAFLKTLEDHSSRVYKLFTIPLDFLAACKDAILSILTFPFRVVSRGVAKLGKVGENMSRSVKGWVFWVLSLPGQLVASFYGGVMSMLDRAGAGATNRIKALQVALADSFVVNAFRDMIWKVSALFSRARVRWIVFNHSLADVTISFQSFFAAGFQKSKSLINEVVSNLRNKYNSANENVARGLSTVQVWKNNMSDNQILQSYHSVNRALADWAVRIEEFYRRVFGLFQKRM